MGKRLAIYIKQFENKDEQYYIYGTELDDYIVKLTEDSDWETVKTYKDRIERDADFTALEAYHRMIKKALKKEVDVIASYSISIFGKNRFEALENINKLMESGVELIFFHEGIKIPLKDGNAYIQFLNKLSSDESIKYSTQTKKQVKKSFQKGKAHTPTTYFLRYDTDKNGDLVINEEEAEIVKRIFNDFLSGKGTPAIAKNLSKEQVKTARGNVNWTSNAVYKIIKQEKYYGAVKTQKSVTLEPHSHKRVLNKDNEQQYLIKNNHPAIISEDLFLKAQRELELRSKKRKKGKDGIMSTYSNTSAYSNEKLKSKKYEAELSEKQLQNLLQELNEFDPNEIDVETIFSKTVQKGTLFNNHRLEIQFKCGIARQFTAEKEQVNRKIYVYFFELGVLSMSQMDDLIGTKSGLITAMITSKFKCRVYITRQCNQGGIRRAYK